MAAGLGFKTFTTGDVLTAGDVNGYLMQGVLVFADGTARDAAITSPEEGQFAYLKSDNKLYYYTGATWAEADTSGIQPSEFAAKGDLLAGTGSATFDNLTVGANDTVLTADSSTATGLKWAALASSSPASARSFVAANESTSSTSYTDLTTAQSVTLTTGTKVLVLWTASSNPDVGGAQARQSIAVSGASTIAAADAIAALNTTTSAFKFANMTFLTVTAGSNTFTVKYKTSTGSIFANNRELLVIDLGS